MTKQFLLKELHRFVKEYHKPPTFREFAKAKTYPAPITAIKEFGTWNKFLTGGNLKVRQHRYDTNTLLRWLRSYKLEHGRNPTHRNIPGGMYQAMLTAFGNIKTAFEISRTFTTITNLNYSKIPTKQTLQKAVKMFIKKQKRNPSLKDIDTKKLPFKHWHFIMNGGVTQFWSNEYPSTNIFTTYATYTAKDGHKCFSLSECILDDWFSKHNIRHKKEIHYPQDNRLNSYNNLRCDWFLIKTKQYVEFAGIYGNSTYLKRLKRKRGLAKKYKMNLIILTINDINSNGHLNEKRLKSLFVTK
mgnify:CR=1 FL=1